MSFLFAWVLARQVDRALPIDYDNSSQYKKGIYCTARAIVRRLTTAIVLAYASSRGCWLSVDRMSTLYDPRCPVARTLEIIGERWTILILRDLILDGPRKFQDFLVSLSGISPNTLSARLKALEESGIIERRFYEEHPPRAEYVLTEKGRDLRPVLRTLRDWGQKHTSFPAGRQ